MANKNYHYTNRILAAITFFISFAVYYDTMAPTVSYWDCGEFIAVSHTLGVPHPPGSPLYLLLGRVASMLPIGEDIAFRVNLLSPIVSAFSVLFLYLIIVQMVNHWRGKISSPTDALIVFGSGIIGSLTFAFTDSHWFNAVEAEVYAFSTFFTAIVVWLILVWNEKADEKGNERYILLIAYMIGLATGLHLLNLLTIPFIALVIYFRKFEFGFESFGITIILTGFVFFIIHNVIIKGMPKIAAAIGIPMTGFLVFGVFGVMVWSVINKEKLLSILFTSLVLVLIGYSTYSLIFIRSNQNPGIDENDPETVDAFISYLEREQYGDVGIFPRRFNGIKPIHEVVGYPEGPGREFSGRQESDYRSYEPNKQWQFFWDYQIRKMYNRYFLWQFAGRGPASDPTVISMGANRREDGVDLSQFGLPLAFILGIIGMLYHARKDERMAFSVMSLFIMTGYAIILYLNQDDPQPRERDYSYVGSFFAFSIWVGLGTAAISESITKYISDQKLSKNLISIALILQIVFVPVVMASTNYFSHDRSGNFVAWDYSYNILQSCEPNGVIFTNGDNDTFPLWYLQEVEKLRTDVAVVNLSLLNTPWYIKQWRDKREGDTKFIDLSDKQIDKLTSSLQRWETKTMRIPVNNDPQNEKGYIEWEMKPTYGGQALRVQDMMILHILDESSWKVPIYFAVTVSGSNRIGLDDYMDMQGLTFQLKSHKTKSIDKEKMYKNLMTDIGTPEWSTNFEHASFYDTIESYNESLENSKKIGKASELANKMSNRNAEQLREDYLSSQFNLFADNLLDVQKVLESDALLLNLGVNANFTAMSMIANNNDIEGLQSAFRQILQGNTAKEILSGQKGRATRNEFVRTIGLGVFSLEDLVLVQNGESVDKGTSTSLTTLGEEVVVTDDFKSWSRQYQPGYMFRNLGNSSVYYNKQTKRLLQNYRSAYMQLAVVYYMEYQRKDRKKDNRSKDELASLKETIVKILDKMEKNIPGDVIEIQSEDLHYQIARIYGDLDEKESMKAILEKLISNENGKPLNRVEYANTFYRELNSKNRAISILEELRQSYMRKERMVLSRGFSNKTVRKGEWNRWEKAYPEIISSLVFIYRENNQFADAEVILSEWVQRNPSDENAKKILKEVRSGG